MIPCIDPVSLLALTMVCVFAGEAAAAPQSHPVVASLEGDGLRARLDQRVRGLVLIGELGCASCHAAGRRQASIDTKLAPRLETVGSRIHPEYLQRFLADPHGTKPGTTMPDMLRELGDRERLSTAKALTHFLLSISRDEGFVAESPERTEVGQGRDLFQTIGCVACHAPRNGKGRETPLPGSVPLGRLDEKYSHQSLTAFLDDPRAVRPSGRMPDFDLAPQELHALGDFLLQDASIESSESPTLDRDLVSRGKKLFSSLGCAQCHQLEGVRAAAQPAAMVDLNPMKGCLSSDRGAWPFFALAPAQRQAIQSALRSADFVPNDEERIQMHLHRFNCVACHQRDKFGGVGETRNQFFTTLDQNLGECGRLPPPLTGIGAKLQKDWLADTLAYGQSIRPFLVTQMPGFGKANTAPLTELLKRVDRLPEVSMTPLPENRDEARAVRDIGHKLVGTDGMNCIACHTFRSRRSAAMAAVDLVDTTGRRLEQEWFYRYMLDPFSFRPDVVMPLYFPGGESIRTDVADGDARRQLEGMWYYLAEGRNTRRPRGLVQPSMKIEVGDEAVILRRNARNTGKRAISVGYPLGVNLTFDAESLGLDQIWWGEFIDTSPVWTGQGSGAVRILNREPFVLPKGPAFVELASADTPWPTVSRRELGHEFLGYDLDAQRRPVFRYVCAGVRVTDAPIDLPADAGRRPILRRTWTFSCASDKTLQFLAAVDAEVEQLDDQRVRVGKWLVLRLPVGVFRIREATRLAAMKPGAKKDAAEELAAKQDAAKPVTVRVRELLVEIPIVDGRADLVIDYLNTETSK